jgi:hypothetical protein
MRFFLLWPLEELDIEGAKRKSSASLELSPCSSLLHSHPQSKQHVNPMFGHRSFFFPVCSFFFRLQVAEGKMSPEEMIYERRQKEGDGQSVMAWPSVDKTNLYLTLPRDKVFQSILNRSHSITYFCLVVFCAYFFWSGQSRKKFVDNIPKP